MHHAANGPAQQKLSPWPPPSGGSERLVTESRWDRRRRPFRRGQIISNRITIGLAGVLSGVVMSIEPSSSLWWHAAIGGLSGLAVYVACASPYQIGQLLGLRPPAPRSPRMT